MRTSIISGFMLATLLTATPVMVSAQDAPATQAAAPADAAMTRKVALVERYFTAINMDEMLDSMMKSMSPMLMEQQRKMHPEISEKDATAMSDSVTESMAQFFPGYMIRIKVLYAESFSEDELTQMVAFYESPVGRSITAKTPELMPKTIQIASSMMPELVSNMQKNLCAKIDCTADKSKPAN
ncbi:MAG: DUF2059 domain-containing protein [Asticcacaulis sp.]